MSSNSIHDVLAAHRDSLMTRPGVAGTAVGLCDGEPCIRVFVVDAAAAESVGVAPRIDGYQVRVEVTGAFHARPAP